MPEEEEHHAYHETNGAASYAQCVHLKLIEKIYELVSEGTTEVQKMKLALKHYVQHNLCVDIKPDVTDRAYDPTSADIHNNIYLAQRACQLSILDQESLRLKVQKWEKENPNLIFIFIRIQNPLKEVNQTSLNKPFCNSPRALASNSHGEVWQYNISYGCYIQNQKI